MIKLFIRKQHEENHKRENAKRVVIVKANPRCAGQQAEDMHMIERLCKDILIAETHDDVLIQTAIAVGYANALKIQKRWTLWKCWGQWVKINFTKWKKSMQILSCADYERR